MPTTGTQEIIDVVNPEKGPTGNRELAEIIPGYLKHNNAELYRLISSQDFGSPTYSRAIPSSVDSWIELSSRGGIEPDPNKIPTEARRIADPYCALLRAVNDGRKLDNTAFSRLKGLTVTWVQLNNGAQRPEYMVRVALQAPKRQRLFSRARNAEADEYFVMLTNSQVLNSRVLELKESLRRNAEAIGRGEPIFETSGFTLSNEGIRRGGLSAALRWDEYCAKAATKNSEKVREVEGQVDMAVAELSGLMGIDQSALSEDSRALITNLKKDLIPQAIKSINAGREYDVKQLIEAYKDRMFEALGGNWVDFDPGKSLGYDNSSRFGMYNGRCVLFTLPSSFGTIGLERTPLDKVRSALMSDDLSELTLRTRITDVLKAAFEQNIISRSTYPELYDVLYPQVQQRAQQRPYTAQPGGFGSGSSSSFPGAGAGTASRRANTEAQRQRLEDIRARIQEQLGYYRDLGVSPSAMPDEIKKAFRRLAFEYHPDVPGNKGNKGVEQRFKKINEAYEILGDAPKRAQYDAWRRNPQAVFKYDPT